MLCLSCARLLFLSLFLALQIVVSSNDSTTMISDADLDTDGASATVNPTSGELIQIQYRNRNESVDVRANVTGGGSDDADSGSDDASGDSGTDAGSGSGVDVDIPAGNDDLTITGQIITFGVGASFEARIKGIPAPSPSDTAAVSQVIEETVAGLSNIANLSITIINNSSERVTFDVNFTAQPSGVEVRVELRYDDLPSAGVFLPVQSARIWGRLKPLRV